MTWSQGSCSAAVYLNAIGVVRSCDPRFGCSPPRQGGGVDEGLQPNASLFSNERIRPRLDVGEKAHVEVVAQRIPNRLTK